MKSILTEADNEKILEAIILGTTGKGLTEDQLTALVTRATAKITAMLLSGRIAEMVLEGKFWVTGLDEQGGILVQPSLGYAETLRGKNSANAQYQPEG